MKEDIVEPDLPDSPEVQSKSVGTTPHVRRRRTREVQTIKAPKTQNLKKVMIDHLAKLSSDLR